MQTLRAVRIGRLISQRQLAALTGIAQSTIVHIENGKRRPHLVTMQTIADVLGVVPSEIAEFAAAMEAAAEGKEAA